MKIDLDGRRWKTEIYDTAGQKEFQTFRDNILEESMGYFVVYSVDSSKSFLEAQDLILKKLMERGKPIYLVGNKLVRIQVFSIDSRTF